MGSQGAGPERGTLGAGRGGRLLPAGRWLGATVCYSARESRIENRGDSAAGAACNVWNMIESGDYTITDFVSEKLY